MGFGLAGGAGLVAGLGRSLLALAGLLGGLGGLLGFGRVLGGFLRLANLASVRVDSANGLLADVEAVLASALEDHSSLVLGLGGNDFHVVGMALGERRADVILPRGQDVGSGGGGRALGLGTSGGEHGHDFGHGDGLLGADLIQNRMHVGAGSGGSVGVPVLVAAHGVSFCCGVAGLVTNLLSIHKG